MGVKQNYELHVSFKINLCKNGGKLWISKVVQFNGLTSYLSGSFVTSDLAEYENFGVCFCY